MQKEAGQTKQAAVRSEEEPLAVLKYMTRRKIAPATCFLFLILAVFFETFVYQPTSMFYFIYSKIVGVLLLLLFAAIVIDILLFKELRLYNDRIVKEWKILGTRDIRLCNARLCARTMPTWGIAKKAVSRRDRHSSWSWVPQMFMLSGIAYGEHFCDPIDVKRFNTVLARVSGRSPEELERTATYEWLVQKKEVE